MKTLDARFWSVIGYDSNISAWSFRKEEPEKDWEICVIPNAQLVNMKDHERTIYSDSGVFRKRRLRSAK